MSSYMQLEEKTIVKKRNNRIKEVFEKIYSYVFSKLKQEKEIKAKAVMHLAIFKKYVEGNLAKGEVQLLDSKRSIIQLPILFAKNIEFKQNDTVVLISWENEKYFYILGKYERG